MTTTIFTIGHSTHQADAFIALLQSQGAELLVDVRRHPGSRRVPWTNATALEGHLSGAGIGYRHLEALGGRRQPVHGSRNGGWRVGQFQGYGDHMGSEEFAGGLAALEDAAQSRRTFVMCAEAQWWRCHRRLLSDRLAVGGWKVLHVDGRGAVQEHTFTEFARVEGGALTYPKQDRLWPS